MLNERTSVRLGAADLSKVANQVANFTFGFECEVATIDNDQYSFIQYNDEDNSFTTNDKSLINPLSYVRGVLEPVLPSGAKLNVHTTYHQDTKEPTDWYIEPDLTIEPTGAELVSPPLPLLQGLAALERILNTIKGDDALATNESTGFHINIGVPDPQNIDLLKLSLLSGETHTLDVFDRLGNEFALPSLETYASMVKGLDITDLSKAISKMNKAIRTYGLDIERAKYSAINIGKLMDYGYIEFRASGGDYSSMYAEIKATVLRYAKMIMVASDPKAERDAYLKKLYKFVSYPRQASVPGWQRLQIPPKEQLLSAVELKIIHKELGTILKLQSASDVESFYADEPRFRKAIKKLYDDKYEPSKLLKPALSKFIKICCEIHEIPPTVLPYKTFI